ncbi:MAG: hypothetical protein EBS19_14125, partial [Spirochaetia bacterium]|nr:hypothetical protein [Spirochaetia bacterium]
KFDHLNQWTPRIFFLLVIILSFHFIRDVKYRDTKLGYVLDEGLEYRFSKEEEWKPYSFKQYISTKPDDLKIWIRIPIPKINPGSRFLFLRVIDGGSRFYFKGIEFYRSGIWSEDGKLIRFPNFFSHIIELPMEALGDVIEAEVYSDWKTVGIYLDIKLLTAGEIPLQFLTNEIVYLVFAFFYLITGAGSLLIYIFIKDPLFKYLGYVALSLCGISLFEMNVNLSSFLWFDFSPFVLYNSYLFLGYSLARFIGFMFGGFFLNYLTYYSTFLLAMGLYGNTAIYHFGFTKYYPDFVEIPLGIGAALGVFSMLVFSIYKSYLGDRNGKIFVASIFIFQLGLFDYLAFQFGLTNKLEPDLYLRFFPIIISLIIIMALRYQDTKNELVEYTRMLEESKSQLETRVKEKTLDLEVANNQLVKAIHSKSEFFANVT